MALNTPSTMPTPKVTRGILANELRNLLNNGDPRALSNLVDYFGKEKKASVVRKKVVLTDPFSTTSPGISQILQVWIDAHHFELFYSDKEKTWEMHPND